MAETKEVKATKEVTGPKAPEMIDRAEYDRLYEEHQKVVAAFNKLLKEYNDLHIQSLFAD